MQLIVLAFLLIIAMVRNISYIYSDRIKQSVMNDLQSAIFLLNQFLFLHAYTQVQASSASFGARIIAAKAEKPAPKKSWFSVQSEPAKTSAKKAEVKAAPKAAPKKAEVKKEVKKFTPKAAPKKK